MYNTYNTTVPSYFGLDNVFAPSTFSLPPPFSPGALASGGKDEERSRFLEMQKEERRRRGRKEEEEEEEESISAAISFFPPQQREKKGILFKEIVAFKKKWERRTYVFAIFFSLSLNNVREFFFAEKLY